MATGLYTGAKLYSFMAKARGWTRVRVRVRVKARAWTRAYCEAIPNQVHAEP